MTKKAKKKAMKTGNRTAMCSRLTTFSIGTDNPPDAKGKIQSLGEIHCILGAPYKIRPT